MPLVVIVCIRQIAAISQVDYGAPVIAIQKRLESLSVERIRTTKWTLLLAPLAWTPMSIVTLKGLFDLDVYVTCGSASHDTTERGSTRQRAPVPSGAAAC